MVSKEKDNKRGVLISGGSGLVGQNLTRLLVEKGYLVHHLSRTKKEAKNYKVFQWNVLKGFIEEGAFEGIDTVIHLAGAGVVDKPWSAKRKKELVDSRVKSAQLIYERLSAKSQSVKTFLSASAIGWYGNTHEKVVKEDAPAGNDFLADLCVQWETAAQSFTELGIRTCQVRIGLVLDKSGGVLKKMVRPIRFGIGGMLGDGSQMTSWIDNDDLAKIFIYLMENDQCSGAYNGTAPASMSHKVFVKTIAKALNKKCLLVPSPVFAIKAVMGEMASALFQSVRAYPAKLLDENFQFDYPDLTMSLQKQLA